MHNLSKLAGFILENHLEEYAERYAAEAKAAKVPLLRFFEHLSEKEFANMIRESVRKFLTELKEGRALEAAAESRKNWEEDKLPGFSKKQIKPSDLVLIYTAQKFALYDFIPRFTRDVDLAMQITKELAQFHGEIQNEALKILFKIQKEIEAELEEKNIQLEQAQLLAHIGSWEYIPDTKKISWSKEMFRIYGLEPREGTIEPQEILQYINPEEQESISRSWQEALSKKHSLRQEYSITNGRGEKRIIETHSFPIYENDHLVKVYGTSQDITDIREAEIERQISLQKDEFMSIASHELKTPLTSVKAYIDLMDEILRNGSISQADFGKYIHKAKDNILKLHSLIADLLDISKIHSGKLKLNIEKLNLGEIISNCVETVNHISSKHVIKISGPSDIIIEADKHRMEQVVMNFLTNAIKYSPNQNHISIHVTDTNSKVTVSVKDQGIGIHPSNHHKIFQRFFRINEHVNKFTGLGIGLYISKEIIERHNGKVWVESEEEKGSEFFFQIPKKHTQKS